LATNVLLEVEKENRGEGINNLTGGGGAARFCKQRSVSSTGASLGIMGFEKTYKRNMQLEEKKGLNRGRNFS